MERACSIIGNPAGSLNFDIQIASNLEHGEEEEDEAKEDQRIKEQELKELLCNAFDDLENEEDDNGSFFQNESSLQSSGSLRNSIGFANKNGDRVINSDHEMQMISEGTVSLWEPQYYIEQMAESESQYQKASENHINGEDRHNYYENVLDHNGDGLHYQVNPAVETQVDGADGDSSGKTRIMEALYAASSREVLKLQEDMEKLKHDLRTENSALRKQLAETEEERAEFAGSLEECEKALETANEEGAKLEGELRARSMAYEAVNENRMEILAKLQAAEATIEGLHEHVNELQKSETLTRTRENHMTVMNNIQERHTKEVHQLNIEIDDLRQTLTQREKEIGSIVENLNRVKDECLQIRQEKGDTVNKLMTALETSQEKCKQLLSSAQLQSESANDKVSVEQLKEELANVRQELNMYQSVSRLGAVTKDDKNGNSPSPNYDNLVSSLRVELERSLASLSAKNEQLKKINAELQSSRSDMKVQNERADKADIVLLKCQEEVKNLTKELDRMNAISEVSASAASTEMNQLKNEKKSLQSELQECKRQIEELVISKKRGDSSQLEREKTAQNIKIIQSRYESQVKKLMDELTQVKSMYTDICKEKDEIEKRLSNEWEAQRKMMIEKWNEDKMLEIVALKENWDKQMLSKGSNGKNDVATEVSKQVAERIKHAKRLWEKEQTIKIEESALAKAKELLQEHLNGKVLDNSEVMIEEYLDQIKELEKRVKETEELYRNHAQELESTKEKQRVGDLKLLEERLRKEHETILRDVTITLKTKFEREKHALRNEVSQGGKEDALKKLLEALEKQLKEMPVALEEQRDRLSKEFQETSAKEKIKIVAEMNLEAERAIQKRIEVLTEAKEAEKIRALTEQEERLCRELEDFLLAQKERFLTALKTMQDSHAKEKAEFQKNYDDMILRIKLECQEQLEERNHDLQRLNQNNVEHYDEERILLNNRLKELEAKCINLENNKQSQSAEMSYELKSTKLKLEECKLKLEQTEADWGTRQEELVVAPLRKEAAILRARTNAAEDTCAQLRLQLQSQSSELKTLNDKYTTLKEKVKKYHRYVHGKEKEFSENLTKLNSEHKSALETLLVDLYNLMLTKDNLATTSNKRCLTPNKVLNNKAFFPQRLKQVDNNEEMKNEFISTVEKVHDDIIKFLNNCGREAVEKIQDEVAKASWVLSEQLRSHEAIDAAPAMSKQTSTDGSRSCTVTPEPQTNGSSGRGTMVGMSAGSTSEGVKDPSLPTDNLTFKPLKFWSSTPFQPYEARFGDISKLPIAAKLDSKGIVYHEESDLWHPLPPPPPVASKNKDCEKTCADNDDRMTKLKMLTEQILIRSHPGSISHSTQNTSEERNVKKNQFLTFSSDLSTLKNEFWKSVNGN